MRKTLKNEAFPAIAETAAEAATLLASGQIIARGDLAMMATHDWRVALYRRIGGEPWDRAEFIHDTATHNVGEGEGQHTAARFYQAAADAFVTSCEALETSGTLDFPGLAKRTEPPTVARSLGKDFRADLGKRAKPPVPAPVVEYRPLGEWHFDAAELLAWAKANRGSVLLFMPPAGCGELLFMASDVSRWCTTLPDDTTCWIDSLGMHFRWREGRGGLNRWPLTWAEISHGTEIVRLSLVAPSAAAA